MVSEKTDHLVTCPHYLSTFWSPHRLVWLQKQELKKKRKEILAHFLYECEQGFKNVSSWVYRRSAMAARSVYLLPLSLSWLIVVLADILFQQISFRMRSGWIGQKEPGSARNIKASMKVMAHTHNKDRPSGLWYTHTHTHTHTHASHSAAHSPNGTLNIKQSQRSSSISSTRHTLQIINLNI